MPDMGQWLRGPRAVLLVLAFAQCAVAGLGLEPSHKYSTSLEEEESATERYSAAAQDPPVKDGAGEVPLLHTPRLYYLDQVLAQYDKRAWPTYGLDYPTFVKVNIYVNSIGPVNANNMEYGMDIYLRQSWQDTRLSLRPFGVNSTVTINGEDIMGKIWKPDLFFRNVKEAKFHHVTVPNKLVKISPDGEVLFSMRLTLRLACFMSFRHFPLDTQRCHILLGPYAQTIDQTAISWQENDPIVLEHPIEVPEFDLVHRSYGQFNRTIDTGVFSFLNVTFTLVRQNGYHLIQTYLPTFLIVMISWVSFWLNVDATPARVTLGVTTLLTMTTVASGVRTQLPPVSYIKAIDVWIGACSVMVFGALLEFTLVNYLSRSKMRPEEFRKSINIFQRNRKASEKHDADEPTNKYESRVSHEQQKNLKRSQNVDRICRVMFPFMFFLFNVIYWTYYLYKNEHV
ncbi:glycine receptor subunit alphaZ1-like isoform X2 [Ornithodoros turicata]